MCKEKTDCPHPEKLKGEPKECSPEQLSECHPEAKAGEHPCLEKKKE